MDQVTERKIVSVNSVMLCSLFWISSPLKLGLIGCPKMSVQNYHSTLCSISEEHRSHMIWRCRPWFGTAWFGALYANLRWTRILKCQIYGKNLDWHLSKYSIYLVRYIRTVWYEDLNNKLIVVKIKYPIHYKNIVPLFYLTNLLVIINSLNL
jgi:hypothetical protein